MNYPFKLNLFGVTSRSQKTRREQNIAISVCLMHQMVSEHVVGGFWTCCLKAETIIVPL